MKDTVIAGILLALAPMAASAEERTVTLAIARMTCAICPVTVTKAINGVQGVINVSVAYDTKRATVRYDDAVTSWERIAEAARNAGYPASMEE